MRVASAGLVYWVARFFLLGTKARILGLTIYTSNSITILASVFLVSRERKIQTSSLNYSYIWIQFQFSSEKSHRVTATEHRTKHFPPPTCRQNIYAHTIPSFSLCLFLHQSPITHTHTHTHTPTHPLSVGDGEGKALQNICCKVRLQSVGLRIMLQ